MEALVAAIAKVDNIAVLVLLLGCAGMGYLMVVWRREYREDLAKMLQTIDKNTEALNGLKNVLSARTGNAL